MYQAINATKPVAFVLAANGRPAGGPLS